VVHDDSELILVHLDGGCSCRQLLHHSGGLGGDSGHQGLGEFGGGGHDDETRVGWVGIWAATEMGWL
jgi:hypothetical protein